MCGAGTVAKNNKSLGAKGLVYHAYPIVNKEGVLTGIVTRHELEEADGDSILDSLIEGQDLLTVSPETSIRDAANMMIGKNFQQVPVVLATNPGKLLGLITLNDIARQQNASEL